MELLVAKTQQGFIPLDDDEAEKAKRFKLGQMVRFEATAPRNSIRHRKFMAMLKVGFEAWEPQITEYKGLPVQKNFKRFRKDCIITAGFYEPVVNLKNEVRAEAKSIAFCNMEEDEFLELYDKVATVLLHYILKTYSRHDLDQVVERILGFV